MVRRLVVARVPVRRGHVITMARGQNISPAEYCVLSRYDRAEYTLRWGENYFTTHNSAYSLANLIRVARRRYISREANADYHAYMDTDVEGAGNCFLIVRALRDIAVGEEILMLQSIYY